jgi:hypothetical protein
MYDFGNILLRMNSFKITSDAIVDNVRYS